MATANWQSERCDHCMENHTFFFRTSWKDSISKKFGLEYDLSCIIWKDAISFSRKYNLTPFSKKHMEIWYFLQMFLKDGLQKDQVRTWPFSCYLERWSLFFRKHDIFSLEKNERWSFSRNTRGHGIFCVHVQALQTWC